MQNKVMLIIALLTSVGCALVWSEPKTPYGPRYSARLSFKNDALLEFSASVKVPAGSFAWYLAYPPDGGNEAFWTLALPAFLMGGLSTNGISGLIFSPGASSVLPGSRIASAFSANLLSSTRGFAIGKDAGLFLLFDETDAEGIEPWSAGFWLQRRLGGTALFRSISMYGGHERAQPDTWLVDLKRASFWTAFQLSARNEGFLFLAQESLRRGCDNGFGWLTRGYAGFSSTKLSCSVSLALSNGEYFNPRLVTEPLSDFCAKIKFAPAAVLAFAAWTASTQQNVDERPASQSGFSAGYAGNDFGVSMSAEAQVDEEIFFYILRGTVGWNCRLESGDSGNQEPVLQGKSFLAFKLTSYCRLGQGGSEEFGLSAVLGLSGPLTCLLTASPIWNESGFDLSLKQELSITVAGMTLKGMITEALYGDGRPPEIPQYGISFAIKR